MKKGGRSGPDGGPDSGGSTGFFLFKTGSREVPTRGRNQQWSKYATYTRAHADLPPEACETYFPLLPATSYVCSPKTGDIFR